jgi:class 3 adenylate cyclase
MVYNMLPMVVSDIGISDVLGKTVNTCKRLTNMIERHFWVNPFKINFFLNH